MPERQPASSATTSATLPRVADAGQVDRRRDTMSGPVEQHAGRT
jgi:hypothetical protein